MEIVKILNKKQLIAGACNSNEGRLRKLVLDALEVGIRAVCPRALIKKNVSYKKRAGTVSIKGKLFRGKRIFVIGAGKAGGAMAEAIEKIIPVEEGIVCVPSGTPKEFRTKKIVLVEGGHPLPTRGSICAAKKILGLAKRATENDLILCLISGGGSALLALPAPCLSLEDKKRVVSALLKRGANIKELNCVRKHLSAIKGGRLAQAIRRPTACLVLSDVVGNPVDVIASGPLVPDESTLEDAEKTLRKYGLYKGKLKKIFEKKLLSETPKKSFPHVRTIILGDNNDAVNAVRDYLRRKGIRVKTLRGIEGEARVVAKRLTRLCECGIPFAAGGETTVKVKGGGVGGRNQELVLSAALAIRRPCVFASIGTDGIDGSSKAAGAIACENTVSLARKRGLNAAAFLQNNDSNSFFKKIGGEIITGHTGTNACDLMIGLPASALAPNAFGAGARHQKRV